MYQDPELMFRRNGDVVLRSTGEVLGTVQWAHAIWVRRYKTVGPKFWDGWIATAASQATDQFHNRRQAGDWLKARP